MTEKVVSIEAKERAYIDSLYALKNAKTNPEKLAVLYQQVGHTQTDARTPEGEIRALEILLIADLIA